MRQSSANNLVLDERMHLGRLFMYTRNKSGPRTVPWGTPDVTDDSPSTMTVCSRCDRNDAIHPCNRRLWATLSNAFAKSSRMASVSGCFHLATSRSRLQRGVVIHIHERLFLKSCWALSM